MIDTGAVGLDELSPYQRALSRLQADAPPMQSALAREIVEADLERPVGEVFVEFIDEPMAAASIGQVHRAVMPDGRQVAVKIQYPGAAAAIRDDLANTELLATFYRFLSTASGVMPDMRQATQELAARISEELDYRHEAANIMAFNELFRGHPFIRIPDVVTEASAGRVLTMTYLDGLDWAAAQHADQDLKNVWAEVIARMVTGSYRHGNLFHADPHPGNYRFGLDGRVGFVDFGCVKVLSTRQCQRLAMMVRAAIDGRKNDLRDAMAETGFLAEGSMLTADEAYQWWTSIVYELMMPQPGTYSRQTSQRAIESLIDLRAKDHPVRRMTVPADFVFFSRLNLSMNSIFAALEATFHVRGAVDDMDGVAEPISELGRQHVAWVRRRGLPFGTDRRDKS
jgi:predicted unusual protein kinase regulating ubiquinone biosynthesis (AarF/ABC1/UbiB family)